MTRTKLLELLFVATAGLGLLFVGWAVLIGSTSIPMSTTMTAESTPIPTITPTPTPQPITLTLLHTNDTWGYVNPCG